MPLNFFFLRSLLIFLQIKEMGCFSCQERIPEFRKGRAFLPSFWSYFFEESFLQYLPLPRRYKVCTERPFIEHTSVTSHQAQKEIIYIFSIMLENTSMTMHKFLTTRKTQNYHLYLCFFSWGSSLLILLKSYFRFLFQPRSLWYVSTDTDALSIVVALHCFLRPIQ